MRRATARTKRDKTGARLRQVNVRVEPQLYRALESVARRERRSVAQAARHLMEEGLRRHTGQALGDDPSAERIAGLAAVGGGFDWLSDEPDLYDDTSGEPA